MPGRKYLPAVYLSAVLWRSVKSSFTSTLLLLAMAPNAFVKAARLRGSFGLMRESARSAPFFKSSLNLVGGGCAEAELCNECFRVEAARAVESFRCCKRNACFVIEVSDHGISEHGGFLFQTVEHHGGHDAVLNTNPKDRKSVV